MAKKKILFVNYSLGVGGIETLILELAQRLDPNKFEPVVCAFVGGGKLQEEFESKGIATHVIPKKEGSDYTIPFKLAMFMRKQKIDLVNSHNQTAWLYAAPAAFLARVPLVQTNHTTADYHGYHTERWMKLERILSLVTRKITTVAKSVADFMVEKEGIPRDKLKVIFNGIKYDLFDIEVDKAKKRNELSLSSDVLVVGCVARLTKIKNQAILIKAFSKVVEQFDNAHLLIVGDGPEMQSLDLLVKELQLESKISLLGNRRDIPELMKVFDVFCLPSLKEGLPIVLLEAMASGLAVIATGVDGNAELVLDGETGIIIPPSDESSLERALHELLTNPDKREKFSISGKQRVIADFSFEKMAAEYEALFSDVISGRS